MPGGKLLKASESKEAARIREAIGVGPDEEVVVGTPQFERAPGMPEPRTPPDFGQLRSMSRQQLRELGCLPWDEPDDAGTVLMLFPSEWYESIPDGLAIESISGEVKKFERGVTDRGRRLGCLAYGVRVRA